MSDQETTDADLRRMVLGCDDRCQDPDMHDFYIAGGAFRWCWPKLAVLRPADTRPRAGLNRYPHNVIGVYVVFGRRGLGLTWKG